MIASLAPFVGLPAAGADFPNLAPYLGIHGGASVRLREWDLGDKRNTPSDDAEAILGLRLGLELVWRFAAEIEVGGLPEVTRDDGDKVTVTTKGTVTAYDFQLLYRLMAGRWSPVVEAGGGAYHSISQSAGREMDPRGHVGVGLRALASDWLAVRVDVRDVFADGPDQAGAHNVEVTAGFDFFRFEHKWPPRDRDSDGIPDVRDACPDVTGMSSAGGCFDGDGDGIVHDKDACPDEVGPAGTGGCPDADGDGTADRDDACPEAAGAASLKGCADGDGDGVSDADDRCPQHAGVAALAGCPDRDGDRVPDAEDRCPEMPGKAEQQGCLLEAAEKLLTGTIAGIRFAGGSATMHKDSQVLLDETARVLQEYRGVRLRIEGHADDGAGKKDNMRLSQARAEAVRDYLIGKGVDGGRLVAIGHGDTRPLPDKPKGGGPADRRIEFTPLGVESE